MPCNQGLSSPGPVATNCITTLSMLEVSQYSAKPAGNVMEMKTNIAGIMKSINWLWAATFGSVAGGVVIFCWMNIAAPTSKARR